MGVKFQTSENRGPTEGYENPRLAGESLTAVVPETVVLGLRLTRTGNFFGIDEMSRPPITLHESPCTCHVHGVPAVSESVVLEADTRLVAGRLAVALDDHAVQAGVTVYEHAAI